MNQTYRRQQPVPRNPGSSQRENVLQTAASRPSSQTEPEKEESSAVHLKIRAWNGH
jgi:hypothetical protein